jgi:protein-tyrosine-phosphatase
MLRTTDLVIVMEPGQARYLRQALGISPNRILHAGDLDTQPGPRAIRDPFQEPLEIFEASYGRLDRCATAVAKVLRQRTPQNAADAAST